MKHPFPFDPTYGYSREQLLTIEPPLIPADFADFWLTTYAEALAVPARCTCHEIPSPSADFKLEEIDLDTWNGRRIGGWLVTPRHSRSRRYIVNGHGYCPPPVPTEADCLPGETTLYLCCRGFSRSQFSDIPGTPPQHVVHGITNRENYVHRGCVADIWAAASALLSLFPEADGLLGYLGGSFGGGIGAMAIAWDRRFVAATLDMPSFGNHPLRLTCPCVGSGEAVRALLAAEPSIPGVLRYFDSAIAARFISIPTLVSPALFDPVVPPPGQFSVYNAIPVEKGLFVRTAAHFDSWPGCAAEDLACRRTTDDWLRSHIGAGVSAWRHLHPGR